MHVHRLHPTHDDDISMDEVVDGNIEVVDLLTKDTAGKSMRNAVEPQNRTPLIVSLACIFVVCVAYFVYQSFTRDTSAMLVIEQPWTKPFGVYQHSFSGQGRYNLCWNYTEQVQRERIFAANYPISYSASADPNDIDVLSVIQSSRDYVGTQELASMEEINVCSQVAVDIARAMPFDATTHTLLFLHVQKTGGTFWENMLMELRPLNSFETELCGRCPRWADKPRMPVEVKVQNCPCIRDSFLQSGIKIKKSVCRSLSLDALWQINRMSGGWIAGTHSSLDRLYGSDLLKTSVNDGRMFVHTLLRDPLQRTFSEYKFNHDWGMNLDGPNDEGFLPSNGHYYVNDFYCSGTRRSAAVRCTQRSKDFNHFQTKCPQSVNRQVRMLGKLPCLNNESEYYTEAANITSVMWNRALQLARQNLASMNFFALNEYLTSSLELLQWTFQMTLKGSIYENFEDVPARNHLDEYTAEEIDTAKLYNQFDIQLYDFALELFKQRLAQCDTCGPLR